MTVQYDFQHEVPVPLPLSRRVECEPLLDHQVMKLFRLLGSHR